MVWTVRDSMLMDDPALLAPEFKPSALGLIEGAKALGLPFKPWETLRDHRRQAAYFAQGRTAPGQIITQAEPGESAHEFGFAIDMVLDVPGVNPWAGIGGDDHRARRKWEPYWRQLADLGRELGLTTGYHHWGWDWPHFQLKNWLFHRPDDWRTLVQLRLEEGVRGD